MGAKRERAPETRSLELYANGGFEQTTVAEIAKRAGLTERTFFRYFGDKREVLFAGADRRKHFSSSKSPVHRVPRPLSGPSLLPLKRQRVCSKTIVSSHNSAVMPSPLTTSFKSESS